MANKNMSVARIERLSMSSIGKAERHNERKNQTYENVNVVPERIAYNVSFKSPGNQTYKDYFDQLAEAGVISTRGLKDDATLFNEMVIDINTMYFEENGGYEFAKQFYEEAYRFACKIYGEDQIVSAVMHADEINKAATEQLGKPVYHYHLHVVAIPTVDKEIKWSKRCKDESLRGTVKEVIKQVSHSKKWKNVPILDEAGNPVIGEDGKPKSAKSYSVLQDQLFEHMTAAGFTGFQRGERGSTAEHLSSLDYQIKQDEIRLQHSEEKIALNEERLTEIQKTTKEATAKLEKVKIQYDKNKRSLKTYQEVEQLGKKGLTGKYSLEPKDYRDLVSMAKEGIASRSHIGSLESKIETLNRKNNSLVNEVNFLKRTLEEMTEKYTHLVEYTRPFVEAMRRFPQAVKKFFERMLPKKETKHEQEIKTAKDHFLDEGAR